MEHCNFACTSCYLTEVANAAPPLSFEKVKQQLQALRRTLGPEGKTQITSGEVTLLPRPELGRIIEYARDIGLVPMVMTNGERFLEDRDYLAGLVQEHGLNNVAIHVDTTQRGRKGLAERASEPEIHSIRDRFADLTREVRSGTGRTLLHAAHTMTVTRDNLGDIPSVIRWVVDNVDAFRILSLQPSAQVGRTIDRTSQEITLDEVWEQACNGVGLPLDRDAVRFGHHECSITCPMIVVTWAGRRRIVESVRRGRSLGQARSRAGSWRSSAAPFFTAPRDSSVFLSTSIPSAAPPNLRHRNAGLRALSFWGIRRWLLAACANLRTLRVSPLALVVHKFMSREELDTPLGRERLQACAFKVPVDGEMVSMCEVNATDLRRRLNDEARATP